jgi:hypothetical protein
MDLAGGWAMTEKINHFLVNTIYENLKDEQTVDYYWHDGKIMTVWRNGNKLYGGVNYVRGDELTDGIPNGPRVIPPSELEAMIDHWIDEEGTDYDAWEIWKNKGYLL